MISRRTVFIIGAGASRELGLPIGEGLKPKIAEALALDRANSGRAFKSAAVDEAVRSYVYEEKDRAQYPDIYQEYVYAAEAIAKALPYALSIDQYLDSQRDNPVVVRLGKVGIAAAILNAERESAIGKPLTESRRLQGSSNLPDAALSSWHKKLVQLLTADTPKAQIGRLFDEVAFIIFNYDRCIEHYLALAVNRYYNTSDAEFQAAMAGLQVIHTYGNVGSLPWQSGPTKVTYGGEAHGDALRELADQLLTFTESAQEGVIESTKALVAGAETVVFMGFGYLPQNLELLHPRRATNALRIFYTTCGISDTDAKLVTYDLDSMFDVMFEMGPPGRSYEMFEEKGTCRELMQNNWMMLTR